MKPSEVRERVLGDHEVLRRMLTSLEALANRVGHGEEGLVGTLRSEGESLLTTLFAHMRWEDRHLAPALREADAWGSARVARLADDHREQRELLLHVLEGLHDESRPPLVLARNLLDLILTLRDDMKDEEQVLLDSRVLRDDVTGVDVETG